MLSHELLRIIAEEREREIQARLRVRRLLGPPRPGIRWRHREAQPPMRPAAMERR